MIRAVRIPDCGNSPRKRFVQELAIALPRLQTALVARRVSDAVRWRILGQAELAGCSAVIQPLRRRRAPDLAQIVIHHGATHGTTGCVSGTVEFRRRLPVHSHDVHKFTSAKGNCVRSITSFVVQGR
jgi:hypothetical protein